MRDLTPSQIKIQYKFNDLLDKKRISYKQIAEGDYGRQLRNFSPVFKEYMSQSWAKCSFP